MPKPRGNVPRPRLRPLTDDGVWAEVMANIGMTHARARHYHSPNTSASCDDLAQSGIFGLYRAVELYDDSLGITFATYATKWIDSYILSVVMDAAHPIRVPRWAAAAAKRLIRSGKIRGDDTASREAACVAAAIRVVDSTVYTTHRNYVERDDDSRAFMNRGHARRSDDNELGEIEARPEGETTGELPAAVVAALNSLSEREQFVLRGRFGLDGEQKVCRELGKELGVSKERARQIEKEALAKLRKYLGVDLGSVINE